MSRSRSGSRALSDCGELYSGGTPSKSVANLWDGSIPWFSSKEIRTFDLEDSELHVSEAGAESGTRVVPEGSVLFVVRGMSLAKEFRVGITKRRATFNQDVKAIVPAGDVDGRYLARCLRWLEPHVLRNTESSSHGTKRLPAGVFENLQIPLPPFPEQRRIADILDKADAVRRKRKDTIALTEELLRSTFLEMFGDPVTNPKGWSRAPLSEFGRITTGNTPPRSSSDFFGDAIEWAKSDNLNTPSHLITRAAEGLSESGREVGRVVPAGSTLMTCIAGSPDCIGNVGLADREIAFNQQINAVTPDAETDARFLYTMLLVGKPLVQAASTASMKGMVSKGRLEKVSFPRPDHRAQLRFGVAFDRLLALQQQALHARDDASRLLDSLMNELFGVATCSAEEAVAC